MKYLEEEDYTAALRVEQALVAEIDLEILKEQP